MGKEKTPIIVGVAQFTQDKDEPKPLDPLSLMVKTSNMAINDTGSAGIREYIDSIYMPRIISWRYRDAPTELSDILGIKTNQSFYSDYGGETPQLFVNRAAKSIASGECKTALLTGAEAHYAAYRLKRGEITLDWPRSKNLKHNHIKKEPDYTNLELKYGITFPSSMYAMFETAIRKKSGRSIEEHSQHMGKLLEHFSKVATRNPHAWSKKFYTAEEIVTPNHENRYICHPYTKWMISNPYVDQSAAIIMTSEKIAEELGIDEKKWIYPMGGADLENIHDVTRRPRFYDSPALKEASQLALEQAGLSLEEIDKFDLYSCFPAIVEIAKQELRITEDDPRDLTVTGGLGFFGGPYNNYSMHAIVSAVELIRQKPLLKIFILANGGYNTRQSIGIYGIEPPAKHWNSRDDIAIQQKIYTEALPEPVEKATGLLTIEAYTFHYNREGQPIKGVVIGRLENGRRTIAEIKAGVEELLKLERQELVGKQGKVHEGSCNGRNKIIIPN